MQARQNFENELARDGAREWHRQNARGSIDAIDQFQRAYNETPFGGLSFRLAPARQDPLIFGDVEVSANLDVLIRTPPRGDDARVGGVLFRLSGRGDDESQTAQDRRRNFGLYVATLVHRHIAEHFADIGEPHRPYCFAMDVRCQELHRAPNNYLRRLNDIQAACNMIAAMWDRVPRP